MILGGFRLALQNHGLEMVLAGSSSGSAPALRFSGASLQMISTSDQSRDLIRNFFRPAKQAMPVLSRLLLLAPSRSITSTLVRSLRTKGLLPVQTRFAMACHSHRRNHLFSD
jgi:hypothetical protein